MRARTSSGSWTSLFAARARTAREKSKRRSTLPMSKRKARIGGGGASGVDMVQGDAILAGALWRSIPNLAQDELGDVESRARPAQSLDVLFPLDPFPAIVRGELPD